MDSEGFLPRPLSAGWVMSVGVIAGCPGWGVGNWAVGNLTGAVGGGEREFGGLRDPDVSVWVSPPSAPTIVGRPFKICISLICSWRISSLWSWGRKNCFFFTLGRFQRTFFAT